MSTVQPPASTAEALDMLRSALGHLASVDAVAARQPARQAAGSLRVLDSGQDDLVDARRTTIAAHRDPRAPQHVTTADLVIQRVDPTSGIGLGRPVQRMLQGTDRIPVSWPSP